MMKTKTKTIVCSIFGHRWLVGALYQLGDQQAILRVHYCPRCGAVEWVN